MTVEAHNRRNALKSEVRDFLQYNKTRISQREKFFTPTLYSRKVYSLLDFRIFWLKVLIPTPTQFRLTMQITQIKTIKVSQVVRNKYYNIDLLYAPLLKVHCK